MSSLFSRPSTLDTILAVLNSGQGQTPLGQMLAGPARELEREMHALKCANTAQNIEVHMLTQENDRLNRENEMLKRVLEMDASELQRENVELKCQIAQERITARGNYVDVSTDLNRVQKKYNVLKKKYEDLTGQEYVGRTPKP